MKVLGGVVLTGMAMATLVAAAMYKMAVWFAEATETGFGELS